MSNSTIICRQSLFHRSRRLVATTSVRKASTSPQRKGIAQTQEAPSLKPFNEIPGPRALPMLGYSAHVLPRIGSFHHTVGPGVLEGLRNKYGNLVRLAKASRTRPVLFVFDPEIMREVYESYGTQSPQFDKSPLCHHRKSVGCPAHGEENKAIWAAVRTLLQNGSLVSNYEKIFDDIALDTTKRLGDLRHAENALNEELETEVYRWALESLGALMFGIRLDCLDGPVHVPTAKNKKPDRTSLEDEDIEQCSLSKRCHEELTPAERLVMNSRDIANGNFLVRSEKTLKTESATFNNALKAFDRHFKLTEHFLTKALNSLNDSELRKEQVLLNKLRPLESRMLPLAADILLAGVDPLVQTTLNLLYDLSLHAARQQRAHDEAVWWVQHARDAGAGGNAGADTGAGAGTGGNSGEGAVVGANSGAGGSVTRYVGACVREGMRLYPVTGGVVRRTTHHIALGGYEVPAGVDIVLAHGVTSKSEKQWGRANSFIPERWCSEGWEPIKASRAHPLASLPFGENCPASGFAEKMISSLLTRVLEKYRLEWHGPTPNLSTTAVNRFDPPFYFVLQKAA